MMDTSGKMVDFITNTTPPLRRAAENTTRVRPRVTVTKLIIFKGRIVIFKGRIIVFIVKTHQKSVQSRVVPPLRHINGPKIDPNSAQR